MSNAAVASLNNSKESKAPAKTGAGQSGLTAVTTTTLVKAVATVPVTINPVANRSGAGVTPPATANVIDRTVATSAGK